MYTSSEDARALVRRFESLRLESYTCPAGEWTIGYGHTAGVTAGQTIDEAKAEYFLEQDFMVVDRGLNSVLEKRGIKLTQPQYDALASLDFNVRGDAAFLAQRVAPRLFGHLEAGRYWSAAFHFLSISRSGDKRLRGLVLRRIHEVQLYRRGTGTPIDCLRCKSSYEPAIAGLINDAEVFQCPHCQYRLWLPAPERVYTKDSPAVLALTKNGRVPV